MTSIL